jgi:hypothetical protein
MYEAVFAKPGRRNAELRLKRGGKPRLMFVSCHSRDFPYQGLRVFELFYKTAVPSKHTRGSGGYSGCPLVSTWFSPPGGSLLLSRRTGPAFAQKRYFRICRTAARREPAGL